MAALGLVFCLPSLVGAHPHVFIDYSITVVFDSKGLAGFRMRWTFDEMSSSGFIVDFDTNKDGRLSDAEKSVMKREAFDYLKNYEYMTHIEIDGKEFKVRYATGFNPSITEQTLVYEFFIPCHVSATQQEKRVSVAVYDEEFYIQFSTGKQAVQLQHQHPFRVVVKSLVNRSKTYYFGQLHPQEHRLSFGLK